MKVWLTRDCGDVGVWFTMPVWRVPDTNGWNGEWGFEFPDSRIPEAFRDLPFPGPEKTPACVVETLEYPSPQEGAKPGEPLKAKTHWPMERGLFLLAVRVGGEIQLERLL